MATKYNEISSPIISIIEQLESSVQRGKRKIRNDIRRPLQRHQAPRDTLLQIRAWTLTLEISAKQFLGTRKVN